MHVNIDVHACLCTCIYTCTLIFRSFIHLEENGITFIIRGQPYTLRGTLALVSGDNLASHYLGGYKSLSSALRKCRHCMAVAEDMAVQVHAIPLLCTCVIRHFFSILQQFTKFLCLPQFSSEAFQSRTRDTHANQCASLGGPLCEHFATTFGLQRDSILNSSHYFHVT